MSDTPIKKFSVILKQIDIPIEDENGLTSIYILKELTGQQRVTYLNRFRKKTKGGIGSDAGAVRLETFDGMITDLLDLCLYAPDGNLVPATTINKWPAGMQQEIFDMAVKLSGLSDKAKDEEKND